MISNSYMIYQASNRRVIKPNDWNIFYPNFIYLQTKLHVTTTLFLKIRVKENVEELREHLRYHFKKKSLWVSFITIKWFWQRNTISSTRCTKEVIPRNNQSSVIITKTRLVDTQTNHRVRPPSIRTVHESGIINLQPPQRVVFNSI